MKKLILYTLGFVLTCSFVACRDSYKEKQRISRAEQLRLAREDSAALKIATTPTMDCLPLFIGVADSLFQKAGVDVRLRQTNAHLDIDTLLSGGHVEGAVTELVRAEQLQRRGTPLRYVSSTNLYWQLMANRMSRVNKIEQLADKMIAITRYSATDLLATMAIDSGKPKNDVYRIQINDVKIRLKMLLNNEMDAELLPEPQATTARLARHVVLMDSRDKNYRFGVIAFREKSLAEKKRQQQLRIFTEVYNSICKSIDRHGVNHYARVIHQYMGADSKTIRALPKLRYTPITAPRSRDVARAKRY